MYCHLLCCVLPFCAVLDRIPSQGVVLRYVASCPQSVALIQINHLRLYRMYCNVRGCVVMHCVELCCLAMRCATQCCIVLQCDVPWRVASHRCTSAIDTFKGIIVLQSMVLRCVDVKCSVASGFHDAGFGEQKPLKTCHFMQCVATMPGATHTHTHTHTHVNLAILHVFCPNSPFWLACCTRFIPAMF